MNSIGIKLLSAVVAAATILPMLRTTDYTYYCSWDLNYTGYYYGNHTYRSYSLPVHDEYRIRALYSNSTGNMEYKTKTTMNGVEYYLTSGGSVVTYFYNGSSNPTLALRLQYSGTGSAEMSGDISYYDEWI